jgi:arsenate reductase-like glutaredoxin family protein
MSEVKEEEHVVIKATPTKDELVEILSEFKKILRATLEVLQCDREKDQAWR